MAFLSKCAENNFDMHDKSIAGDPNRPHFLLHVTLSIQWERNRLLLSRSVYIPQWKFRSALNNYGDQILLCINQL